MSYDSATGFSSLDKTEIRKEQLKLFIHQAWEKRRETYTQVDTILQASKEEDWSNNILKALLDTLSFERSFYGNFGTPDRDLLNAVISSGERRKTWVKLLGIKIGVLFEVMDNLPDISDLQKDRIRGIDSAVRKALPHKK